MASEHDRSAFVEPLPARPNLEMQQTGEERSGYRRTSD
jgi:hypothetical protein